MASPRLNELVKAALGIYAVYLVIVIARAGYETGQVLAGKVTAAEAMARFDVSGALLVLGGFALFWMLRNTPPKA
jgi:hypothetical protein